MSDDVKTQKADVSIRNVEGINDSFTYTIPSENVEETISVNGFTKPYLLFFAKEGLKRRLQVERTNFGKDLAGFNTKVQNMLGEIAGGTFDVTARVRSGTGPQKPDLFEAMTRFAEKQGREFTEAMWSRYRGNGKEAAALRAKAKEVAAKELSEVKKERGRATVADVAVDELFAAE